MDDELFQHANANQGLTIKHNVFGAQTEGFEYTRHELISSTLLLAATIAEVQRAEWLEM